MRKLDQIIGSLPARRRAKIIGFVEETTAEERAEEVWALIRIALSDYRTPSKKLITIAMKALHWKDLGKIKTELKR